MTTYDAVIYFLITSARAAALGLAVTIAAEVLPGSRRTRAITHWAIVGTWALAVLWANLLLHENVGLRPRLTNVLVELYLVLLLALHTWRRPLCRASSTTTTDGGDEPPATAR